MSLLRSESFDTYSDTLANMTGNNGWGGTSGTVVINGSPPSPMLGSALRCNGYTGGSALTNHAYLQMPTGQTDIWISLEVYFTALPNAAGDFLFFGAYNTTTATQPVVQVYLTQNGEVAVYTQSANTFRTRSASGVIQAAARHHVAMRINSTNNNSTGNFEFWVDGVDITGAKITNGAVNWGTSAGQFQVSSLAFGGSRSGSTSNYVWWDSIIVGAQDGSGLLDRLPDTQIKVIRPSADLSTTDWTQSAGSTLYEAVDDADFTGTDYIASSTVAAVASMSLQDVPSTDAVRAVVVKHTGAKDDAGARTHRARINDGSNTSNGTTRSPAALTYALYTDYFSAAPDSGGWDSTKVNNLALQFEVVS
jgi:hypothetical protein